MGGRTSKEETSQDAKLTGQVNNNVVVDNHLQITNKEVLTILYVIAGVMVLQFLYKILKDYSRGLKKQGKRSDTVDRADRA